MTKFLFDDIINPIYIVFFRIATGLILLFSMVSLWPDFKLLYSLSGIVDHELLQIKQGHSALSIYQLITAVEQALGFGEPQLIMALFIGYLILCVFLIVGFISKPSAIILLLLHGIIFTAQHQFSYGFDYFCTISLFYCVVFPVHRYGSVDRILFSLLPSRWSTFCLRILQLHICLVYFFSGLEKIVGHTWRNGEALWKTVQLPYFEGAINFDALAPYPWLWVIGGWGIALTELIYPLFIFNPKTRNSMLALILGLHVSIALVLGLYLFSAIMIALNLAASYYPYLNAKNETHTLNQPINPLPIDSS